MFENLSKEVLEKVKQAKSREEALNILKENGITLTDEDLTGVAGGDGCIVDFQPTCPPDCGLVCYQHSPFRCLPDETCPKDYCSYNVGP